MTAEHHLSEARFRTLFENAPFMIDSFDENGRAVLWNRRCTELLGYTLEELNSFPNPLAVFYPDEAERARAFEAVMKCEGKFYEYRVRRKDGAFVHQMWANFSLPGEAGTISVGYDVTEMNAARQALSDLNQTLEQKVAERTQQLEAEHLKVLSSSKFAALGQMAAGVAHEINNPLAVIAGHAQQLEEICAMPNFNRELAAEMLQSIRSSVKRITKIIAGMRSISRDGSRDPMQVHSLEALLGDLLALCRERFQNEGVRLDFVAPNESIRARCRSVELQQVVLNLLNNAFDAVRWQEEKWVRLELRADETEVAITVVDSGPGVSPSARAHLFQPFFTTKPVGQGTGLGLSISKGIVEAHGGTISAEPTMPGQGARFVVKLPRA